MFLTANTEMRKKMEEKISKIKVKDASRGDTTHRYFCIFLLALSDKRCVGRLVALKLISIHEYEYVFM